MEKGTKFCVCVKEILPWMAMPLQIAYVADASSGGEPTGLAGGAVEPRRPSGKSKASFSFGSGTLRGHLLVRASALLHASHQTNHRAVKVSDQ